MDNDQSAPALNQPLDNVHLGSITSQEGYDGEESVGGSNGRGSERGSDEEDTSSSEIIIKQNRRNPSSTGSIVIEQSFQEATGCEAGQVVDPVLDPEDGLTAGVVSERDKDNAFQPFRDETDYAYAHWLYESDLSKGAVQRMLVNPSLSKLHTLLSFHSAEEWLSKIQKIPYGPMGIWQVTTFETTPRYPGSPCKEYRLLYRDIVGVIRFLLGHEPFKDDLVYAPVRHTNQAECRVFTELHTANWWWETQEKLPPGATVVPLLTATDKTALTQHRGDLKSWPVYMTIGNLLRATRRNQKRPGLILIGFLPILGRDDSDLKAQVWHQALDTIFER